MKKCWVFSNQEFNHIMEKEGWQDGKTPEDVAFISICDLGFEDPKFDEYHWFRQDAENVINLNFADIDSYQLSGNGKVRGMTDYQAKRLYEFIKQNLGKHFFIHCAAGVSRSQGVAKYITDTYFDLYPKESLREDNPCDFPNLHVVSLLKQCWRDENQIT